MFGFCFVPSSSRWRSDVSASSCTPVELRRARSPRVATFGCKPRLVARTKKDPDRRRNESSPISSSASKAQVPNVEGHAPDLKEFLPPTMREFMDCAGEEWQRELELAERNRDAKSVAKPKKRPEEGRMYDLSVYSIAELAEDYRVPPEWLIEVLVDIGLELPIRLSDTLADLNASEEEIQELLDRLHGVCREDVLDCYTDETLEELAEEYEVDIDEMLAAATEVGIILSIGPMTHIRHEQKVALFKRLGIYT